MRARRRSRARAFRLIAIATTASSSSWSSSLAPRSLASTNFADGITTGTIKNASITEASGIVASRINPNVLWTQEDSGNPAQLYALTPAGTDLGTYVLSGAGNTDWEDIALGPGPTAGVQYLYAGDIGDNNWNLASHRNTIAVYRVAEPTVSDTQSPPVSATLSGVSKFTFAYPDGPHDAESMFVDPLTRDIYIITKRDPTFKYVYRAAYPQSTSGTTTLTLAATLTNSNALTAADISPDGSQIIIRSYATTSGLMYTRPAGGSVADAFATTPVAIPILSEVQGEAIGFDPNGWGYYTTSEGSSAPIHYFNRLPPPGEAMYWDTDGVAAGSYLTSGAGLGGGGTWDASSTKWYNGSANVAWVDGNDAVFWGSVAGSVTLSAARSLSSLTFKTNGYTITGSTLTLGGSNITVDAGVTATISSIVAGSSGLTKNGAGTLVLTNSSNQTSGYTGGTIINAGTLNIASGTLSHSGGGVTINNGATLAFAGSFTLASSRSVMLGGGGGGVFNSGAGSIEVAGVVSGSGSLTKTGAGTLTLSNANTYIGATTVSAGTLVIAHSFTSGASINVTNAAMLSIPAASAAVLKTGSVSTAGSGSVDLTSNKLIVTGQSVAAVTALIASGRNGGSWTGGGIVTSTASGSLTSLGVATAGQTGKSTFGGLSVTADDVLVMFTYGGDANLDGKINVDDYGRIDLNVNQGIWGWYNGDFNYDGKVNVDDYGIIDFNVGIQGAPFPTGAGVESLSAVPEAGGAMTVVVASLNVMRCQRRKRVPRCVAATV